jgi:hypothetical protein
MKAIILICILGTAFVANSFGKIGDDEKAIEAAYGKPAKVLQEKGELREVGYSVGAMAVVIDFVNGESRREGFAKADTSILKENEIQQILNFSAAPNTTWKEDAAIQGDRKWKRSDGKAEAFFPARQTYLVVQGTNSAPKE